jgi:hypothetical protein
MEFKAPEFVNDQAIINYLGRKTAMRFEIFMDETITFRTVVAKSMNEDYLHFDLTVGPISVDSFLSFETVEDLCRKRNIVSLQVISTDEQAKMIYHNPEHE